MESRGIDFYSHLPLPPEKDNPAIRPDPTQPVPEADWNRLPINKQTKKLDKACFVYNAEQDVHYCPRGEVMPFEEKTGAGVVPQSASCAQLYRFAQSLLVIRV